MAVTPTLVAICSLAFPIPEVPPGYTPHSWNPAMGYGTTVVQPSGVTGNAFGVTSGYQFIQYSSWVSDQDEYQRGSDHAIVQLKNSATDVNSVITSGELIIKSSSYDDSTGKRIVTFVIKAKTVALNTIEYCVDTFIAKDIGGPLTVKDADGSEQLYIVTVTGPTGSGGGG